MKQVLVLGASGRFGQAAAQAFGEAGWRVLAPARSQLGQLDALGGGQPVQLVVHALNPPYTAWRKQAMPLLRRSLALARHLGAAFVLPGNVYNFGTQMPGLLKPDTPQQADTVKGRIRVEMEAALAEHAAASGLSTLVLRAGDFFGAGRGTWFDLAIVKDLARGRLVYPGPTDVAHAWAYLPDLAQALVRLAEVTPPRGGFERLHFAGHAPSGRALLDGLAQAAAALGVDAPRGFREGGMPWGLLRAGSLFVPMWRELTEMAYLWQRPHALDGSALAARIGAEPHTPLDLALRRSLQRLGFGSGILAGALPVRAEAPQAQAQGRSLGA